MTNIIIYYYKHYGIILKCSEGLAYQWVVPLRINHLYLKFVLLSLERESEYCVPLKLIIALRNHDCTGNEF